MKKYLTIILLTAFHCSFSQKLDSILFSNDGKYFLIHSDEELTRCEKENWELYEKGKDDLIGYVVLGGDSVLLLSYDTIYNDIRFKKYCGGLASIVDQYLFNDFINKYDFNLKGIAATTKWLTWRIDVLDMIKKKLELGPDSLIYYTFKITVFDRENKVALYTNDVITNYPDMTMLNPLDRAKLYYSVDKKYYFLSSEYCAGEDTGWGSSSTDLIWVRKLGINKP